MFAHRYRSFVALLCQVLAALVLAPAASAAPNHIAARLVAGPAAGPGGETMLAILMTPEKGWHGYWLNPGDAGLGMRLDWTVPEGARVGEPRYPVPRTLVVQGLMNHVYESEYAVLVPLALPPAAQRGSRLPIWLKAQWLACTEQICVPERAQLATEIGVRAPGPIEAPSASFAQWQQRLPAPLDRPASMALDGKALRLAIPLPASVELTNPHLFVREDKVIDYAAPQRFARLGNALLVTIPRARFDAREAGAIEGVLKLDDAGNGVSFIARPGKVPTGGEPLAGGASLPALPLLLLAALAGGLLLNVMPCVFPILSLKALSLARAGESEAHARIEGLAYAGGVILACLLLGGALLALRAGGQEVGWAFQLQEPLVVVGLALLALAITVNLLGWFELAVPGFVGTTAGHTRSAFATGMLAAFVATPCTGPFMASAMGAALLLPVPPALALFAVLGLGIALPFLGVAWVPALRRRLPRPGGWMSKLRHWLAVPMALTALALGWLVWKVGGAMFASVALLFAALLVLALIGAGQAQRRGKSARGPAILALFDVLACLALLPDAKPERASASSLLDPGPFSEQALAQGRREHRPVFVWMTADWCLSCKVNEEVAIEREETRAAFRRADVLVLRGDWTRRDPAITRYLTAHGAAGVPLYVWYGADGRARTLPQVLTAGRLIDEANQAGAAK